MFDTINSIKWTALRQAHGDASHVPAAIRDLLSEDSERRRAAYWQIDNHVILQGDLYESAFYCIPYLVEILSAPEVPGKKQAYDLLIEVANGYAPPEIRCLYNEKQYSLVDACQLAISDCFEIYLAEVRNTKSIYRNDALWLLVSLAHHREEILQGLMNQQAIEEDVEFRMEIEKTISEIKENMQG
ncbi:hypothetical protein [Chitinimonas sp. JJ19]|uniref:hypothetical protein n=1 Tax=Chitinimonas sp. JJ19 TaxID=3109352 RepID=UPI003001D5B6